MTEIVTIPCGSAVLHGVVHLPARQSEERVGVFVSLNNVNSKVGSHRLYFRVAEAVAEAGFYALRYDNRGTCDSPGSLSLTFADRLADARAALDFFRTRYELHAVVGWGQCLGATVSVHCATLGPPHQGLDGLILCNILADPARVTLAEFDYRQVNVSTLVRDMVFDGHLLQKLWQAPRKLHVYRQNLPKLALNLLKRYRSHTPELERLRAAVGRAGELLVGYPGPCLMVFAERDVYWKSFVEKVNPGDRLGLAKKEVPPDWALVKDGDHSFASREQTGEAIRYTVEWLGRYRQRYLPNLIRALAH